MRAATISIGDELLLGQAADTNSTWLGEQLAAHGVLKVEHRTLPDDQRAIADAVRELAQRVDVVLITGGLGPTADDLTREALNDVIAPGKQLVLDHAALQQLTRWFERRGKPMPALNRKQATRPASTELLANPHGTAPGLAGAIGECRVFSMPGPPQEMRPMFLSFVAKELKSPAEEGIITAVVEEYGLGEADAAERLGPLMDRNRNPLVGTTASQSVVAARVRGVGHRPQMTQQVEQTVAQIEQAWHPYAFGRGGATLAAAATELLLQRDGTLVTAESCTGGLLSSLVVDVAGCSGCYVGGWVTYSNELKSQCIDVPEALIEKQGAVSEQVARAMAEGAIRASGAEFALAVTGIAGPDGGTPHKPVGTVFIGLAHRAAGETETSVRRFAFTGDRQTIRDRAAKAALQMMRFRLMNIDDQTPLLWELPLGASLPANTT